MRHLHPTPMQIWKDTWLTSWIVSRLRSTRFSRCERFLSRFASSLRRIHGSQMHNGGPFKYRTKQLRCGRMNSRNVSQRKSEPSAFTSSVSPELAMVDSPDLPIFLEHSIADTRP